LIIAHQDEKCVKRQRGGAAWGRKDLNRRARRDKTEIAKKIPNTITSLLIAAQGANLLVIFFAFSLRSLRVLCG
jgi:hypothetical protein